MGKVLKPFAYVPVKEMGPNYLRNRFAKIRAEQKAAREAEAQQKVTPIKRAAK